MAAERPNTAESGDAVDSTDGLRVLVVDDHRVVAESLSAVIAHEDDLVAAGSAYSVHELEDLLADACADVVLMDVMLPDGSGVDATTLVKERCPDASVLVMTAYPSIDLLAQAAAAGADGFLPKDADLVDMLGAIRAVASHGGMLITRGALSELLAHVQSARPEPEPLGNGVSITSRERQVLDLLGEGLDPKSIARHLGISVHTSRGYVRSLLQKLGAHSQLEAVVIAARKGILARVPIPGDGS
jgi:DNA-binding NarL/FixJ family response regulator